MQRVRGILRTIALVGPPLIGSIALGVRHWRGSQPWELAMVASAPYLTVLAVIGPVVAAVLRRWWMVWVSTIIAAACLATQLPLYIADDWPVTEVRFSVMTQNADLGRADAMDVVAAVRRHKVDALVITELTPPMRGRLQAAGLDDALPFTALRPMPGARGTGIWSRTPLEQTRFVRGFACAFVVTRADVDWGDGHTPGVRLVGVHLIGPTWDASGWRRDAETLPARLRQYRSSGRTIVAGDLNATPDSPWFRDALDMGFGDAADEAGAGLIRTYPANFPVLAIDHVLTSRGLVGQSVTRVRVAGTDHRGVVATVAVPVT